MLRRLAQGVLASALLAGCPGCGVGGAGEGALPTIAADPERMPPQPCRLADLSLTATPVTPDGTVHLTVANRGSHACTVSGAPLVTVLDDGYQTRALGAGSSARPQPGAVRLDPGGSGASATTTIQLDVTGPAAGCVPVTTLWLSIRGVPDPSTPPLTVPVTATVCSSDVGVAAFSHT